MVVVDGKAYEDISQAPDLGSLECIDDTRENQRDYQGFLEDRDKLPTYDDLGTGSTALLYDPNGVEETVVLKYQASTKKWYEI